MSKDKEIGPVEVFAGSAMQANLVRSILEDNDIEAFLKDEFIGTLYPWHASPGGAGAVKVVVSYQDYEKAKSIVAEYENNLKDNNNQH